jgi:hypothetical protein
MSNFMKQGSLVNNGIRNSQITLITKTMFYKGNNHCLLQESYNTNRICEINVGFPNVTVGAGHY